MSLSIVFDQSQVVLTAQFADTLGIGTATVEMDNENGLGTWRDSLFNEPVIHLQSFYVGFHQYGLQTVFRDG